MTHVRRIAMFGVAGVAVALVLALGQVTRDDSATSQLAWAQVSSCGNAILEPGEQCDPPGSITCPGNLPCSSDCTCPPVPLDHFQCYEVKPAFFASTSVTVQDQFGTMTETVRQPHRICNPANKNGEGIIDPTDHLVGYQTKA